MEMGRMEMDRRVKKDRSFLSYGASAAVLLLLAVSVYAASLRFAAGTGTRQQEALKKAVTRASVQCYAIEGRYPPSVEYLEENYGIHIDRKKYHVFYDGFASNVMPEITIIPAEKSGGQGR